MRTCRLCPASNPNDFYETQSHRLCKACFKTTYYAPGRERLLQSKLDRGECTDCGVKVTPENAVMFDYDHRNEKTENLSRMSYAPAEAFQAELEKCDLTCANCHRLRTQARGYAHIRKGGRPRKPQAHRPPSTLDPAPF